MVQSRVCQLLGVQYPIIQAGLPWLANAELAVAVSEAGGLGLVTPTAGLKSDGNLVENFREQLRRAKSFTGKPIGVGLFLGLSGIQELMDVAVEEGVHVAVTHGGSPALHTGYLKERGMVVLHLVASVHHARSAEAQDVDIVVADGFEGGGARGREGIPTFTLVPQVVDAVEIPVVASGGICDARGYAAALALGAEGVHLGTRFVATHECIAHSRYKEAIIRAVDTGTVVVGGQRMPVRLLRTEAAIRLAEEVPADAGQESWEERLTAGAVRTAVLEGKLEEGLVYASTSVGLVSEITSAREVVESLVKGLRAIGVRLQ